MDIKVNLQGSNITKEEIEAKKAEAGKALDRLWSGKEDMTGWVKAPLNQNKEELDYLLNVADIVKQEAQLMIVIGIGGSYMGAKAAIEALVPGSGINANAAGAAAPVDGIDVRFAGINFCSAYHKQLMAEAARKETVLCVISKSGNTLEIKAAFDIFKSFLEKKYGSKEAAAKRIITITDKESGALRAETTREGYVSMEIPRDIGGRYSAMTAAGLFPMAVAGIDVRALIEGEKAMANSPDWDKDGTDYAITRYLMLEKGKNIETMVFFDCRLHYLGEWLKQLYGESEGKDGKGLYPASLDFSTDLHSMGQFLQQGSPVFFETAVLVDEYDDELEIPQGDLAGKTLEDLNRAAVAGVITAHRNAGNSVIEIHMPTLDAYYYGQLLYFFQTTCAVTAMLMGVTPFDQPGVEEYKKEMRKELEKK